MLALLIEDIERNHRAGADGEVVRSTLEKLILQRAQNMQRNRRWRAHVPRTLTGGGNGGGGFKNARANALARHFHEAEMRNAANLNAGAIVLQRILQPAFNRAVVA